MGWMAEEGEREKQAGTKGSLRKALHVKAGQKIPESKLKKAEHSKNLTLRQKANMAERFAHARKRGKKSARKKAQ